MRILLVNRFFGDSHAPTGRMLWDVAARLHTRKHQILVLTSEARYAGGSAALGDAAVFDVCHVGQWEQVPRVLNWLWFWLNAVCRIPFMRWDRCVLLTDPPFLSLAAWAAKLVYGARRRVYLWTMDLYPEALVASGRMSKQGLAYKALRALANLGLRRVDGVIALGETQMRRLAAYTAWRSDERFAIVVPPWDERPLPRMAPNENPVLARFGWHGRKVAVYAGNLGEGHTFEEFVDAARALNTQGRTDWVFAFFVRGARVAALKRAATDLSNVVVHDYLPDAETAALLWSATVHLISMQPGWEGVIVPSKLYGVLKTDAPVLFVGPRDAETAVEIARLRRGQRLALGCDGASLVAALGELEGQAASPSSGNQRAADRVALFIEA